MIGTAFTAVVTSLVEGVITPVIAAIGGEPDFSVPGFTLNGSEFRYGDFINALLADPDRDDGALLLRHQAVNSLLRLRTEPPVAEETRHRPECLSEIPIAARRCAFCRTQVAAA